MRDPEQARQELGHVSIACPDPSWPKYFSQEREYLRPILGSVTDDLEHYGSTAVPWLSAKPVIDMMAPVLSLDHADALGEHLARAGYRKIDVGFFKRRFFRRKVEGAELAYHLHLVVCPNWPLKNELMVRDWLIQNPDIARSYETLKMKLAAECGDDMLRYTDGKTLFLRRAVNDARLSKGLPAECDWDE
jgi:GrpB-like predicted nucleotidyltransferase (UPF0157 family)